LAIERFRRFLLRHGRIAIDTNIFIYLLEENPRYVEMADLVFSRIESQDCEAVTSTIVVTELLVPAYREGDGQRIATFYSLLATYPNLTWAAPDMETADLAAELRSEHRLRTPDALLAATALRFRATAFVTNDSIFARVPGFETAVLERFI
jgi:predicted nucleic acid-binding protein